MKKNIKYLMIILFILNVVLVFIPIVSIGDKTYTLIDNNGFIVAIISILQIIMFILNKKKMIFFLNSSITVYYIIFISEFIVLFNNLNLNFPILIYFAILFNILIYVLIFISREKRCIKINSLEKNPNMKLCKHCNAQILSSSSKCFFCGNDT